jgi:hypothetical protein
LLIATPRVLDALLEKYAGAPEPQQAALESVAKDELPHFKPWAPNEGPQYDAWSSEADEVFYGGQAGGGKTDLLIGLGLIGHHDSLILRRVNDDVKDVTKRAREILDEHGYGYRFNGQDRSLQFKGHVIRFAGCQYEEDKERFKGRAKDFYGFDEIGDFTRSQYKFITAWNRSTRQGQRCRVVAAGNPPTRPEGLWILQYWGAWLDPRHARPAKFGELRWYTTDDKGNEVEVDGRGPHVIPNCAKPVYARSRTFIPAELKDNPDLLRTNYQASLDALDPSIRSAYRDGNFQAELKDDDYQVIPTAWIKAAQERWKPDGWKAFAMTALAVDPAGGGADAAEIIWRHGGWYAPPVTVKGPETADGSAMAGRIIQHRRDNCPVIDRRRRRLRRLLHAAAQRQRRQRPTPSTARKQSATVTRDAAKLRFVNKRAEAYWRFREALDPDQEGGSVIALPPDDELKADLCAVHWELAANGIKLEPKIDIKDAHRAIARQGRRGRDVSRGRQRRGAALARLQLCERLHAEGQRGLLKDQTEALMGSLFGSSGKPGAATDAQPARRAHHQPVRRACARHGRRNRRDGPDLQARTERADARGQRRHLAASGRLVLTTAHTAHRNRSRLRAAFSFSGVATWALCSPIRHLRRSRLRLRPCPTISRRR